MDSQFWIKAWIEGRTNFHKQDSNDKLTEFFPKLNPQAGQSVLVPLCGKSKDLLWLSQLELNVHGVELSDRAIEDFFQENQLSPIKKTHEVDFVNYAFNNILISCGDFFKLAATQKYDFVYDRAALVALPAEMRKTYAQVIKRSLKSTGKYLLISYEYDQTKMEGPPFSVTQDEVRELYEDSFTISLLEIESAVKEGPRLSSLEGLRQTVYLLEPKQN